MPGKEVRATYLQAAGKWTGCDWPTTFGQSSLDLNGLQAAQAAFMARATAGGEAADWQAAVHWLEQVEQDAEEADEEARTAADLAACGDLSEALEHARRACAIESQYHRHLIWRPVRDAAEAAWEAAAEDD